MRISRTLLVLLAAALLPLGVPAQPSHYTLTQIADVNDYAGYFEAGTITNHGDILFAPGLLNPPNPPNSEGVLFGAKECRRQSPQADKVCLAAALWATRSRPCR